VPEKQHSFYAHWVRQLFNRYSDRSRRSLGPQEISDFLESVRVSGSAEIWQVSQARDALILYYEPFRGFPELRATSSEMVLAQRPYLLGTAPLLTL